MWVGCSKCLEDSAHFVMKDCSRRPPWPSRLHIPDSSLEIGEYFGGISQLLLFVENEVCIRYVSECVHASIHLYVRTYIHTYIHTYVRTFVHSHIHNTYIHTYIHTSIHPSIHTYIHTYIQTDRQTDRHYTISMWGIEIHQITYLVCVANSGLI